MATSQQSRISVAQARISFLSSHCPSPPCHRGHDDADENGANPGVCSLREAVRAINDQGSFGGLPGGGLFVSGGDRPNTATLTNVTFFGNSAGQAGGLGQSQENLDTLSVTLSNVTFAGNVASEAGDHFFQSDGLLSQPAGETSLRNVLFGPSPGSGCGSTSAPVITLLGGNMDSDGSCGVERTEADPGLAGAPASLGGFTPFLPLVDGAAAIDVGTTVGCPAAVWPRSPAPLRWRRRRRVGLRCRRVRSLGYRRIL